MAEKAFHVCNFTDFNDLTIEIDGESFRFSFSKQFGPTMIGKSGNEIEWRPPNRSQFWKALHRWCHQEYRVVAGRCVYERPTPTRFIQIDKKNLILDTPEVRAKFAEFIGPHAITIDIEEWWAAGPQGRD